MDNEKEGQQNRLLLEKVRAMMDAESALTATMEKVEPWLPAAVRSRSAACAAASQDRPRVRPIPLNSDEARRVLAVARTLAARTSAPAGWNPNAPVVGFSTPSPLPHQLRGGALAALQLERARQAERDRKRRRQQELEQASQVAAEPTDVEGMDQEGDSASAHGGTPGRDPKRREINTYEKELGRSKSDLERESAEKQQRIRQQQQQQHAAALRQQQQQQQQDVSMNLSDSSSSESESDSD